MFWKNSNITEVKVETQMKVPLSSQSHFPERITFNFSQIFIEYKRYSQQISCEYFFMQYIILY